MATIKDPSEGPQIKDEDIVIAERNVALWAMLFERGAQLIDDVIDGRLKIALNASRGIVGPTVDGMIRMDVELLLAPTEGNPIS